MKPKKIIWVIIDTLRADHLGCYGYVRNTTPNIDNLAKNSILFEHAFAPAPYTMPAVTSMITSKYPDHHSTKFSMTKPINSDNDITIAEVLKSCGYRTAGLVSSYVLETTKGINSGFDYYDDTMTASEQNRPDESIRNGKETNKVFFKWLDKNYQEERLFVFLHYFDVHGPYVNMEPFNKLFAYDQFYGTPKYLYEVADDDKPHLNRIPHYQVLNPIRDEQGNLLSYEKDVRYYIAQYDGGISYVDTLIKEVVTKLKQLNIYDECLIIITADHGEALGENGVYFFHGLSVTADQIKVPLIVKPHKSWKAKPKAIQSPVSTIDIMPTILDLVGYEYDKLSLEGQSLVGLAESGKSDRQREIISEIEGQIAYIGEKDINIKPKKVDPAQLTFFHIKELCEKEIKDEYKKKDDSSVNWSDPYLDSSKKLKAIRSELKTIHKELETAHSEHETTRVELEATRKELKNTHSELEIIHNSTGWKLLRCYYKFRDKILPPNSKRRVQAKRLWRWQTKP